MQIIRDGTVAIYALSAINSST